MEHTISFRFALFLMLTMLFKTSIGHTQITPIQQEAINIIRVDECRLLEVALKPQNMTEGPCCYKVVLNNKLSAQARLFPAWFQASIKNGNITHVFGTQNPWQQTPASVPAKTKSVIWKQATKIPGGQTNLATICVEGKSPVYLQYAWLDRTGKTLCRDSTLLEGCNNELTDLCDNPLLRNGEFAQGITRPPVTQYWSVGYGSPQFLNTPNGGFFNPGYAAVLGNQTTGSAIAQALSVQNKIRQGKKYILSVGVRYFNKPNAPDYARIRVIAYNGALPANGTHPANADPRNAITPPPALPANGTHPAPGANIAIIGRSGKIRDCGDWSVIEFPVWTANKDFQNIALNVFTNDGATATLWIDNVYLCETNWGSDCEEVQLDAKGNPIVPAGYGAVPAGFTCPPEAEEEEYDNGSLQDLYGYNGTASWYAQATDKCFSIGGTLPPEVLNYNCDDSLKMMGINMTCNELQKMLEKSEIDTSLFNKLPNMLPIPVMTNNCDVGTPIELRNMAFGGKDIIYIHGLQLDHLCDRANNVSGAGADWPINTNEFYTGYYKTVANANWQPHIDYFLRGKGNKNRYLIVTYNCSQRAEVAVHSVLSQIWQAMENGKEVQVAAGDPRGTNCFGRDFVFVSHSTGAIVADAALTIAHYSRNISFFNTKYGDISLVSDRCKGRVSLHGAFTGSSLATVLVVTQQNPLLSAVASTALTAGLCKADLSIGIHRVMVLNSILVDLIPPITRAKWGPLIAAVPVPVLNVSGGHPTASVPILKFLMHIGYDDGVVSMDCANTLINQPSNFASTFPPKVYDMGINRVRANNYFLDQRLSFNLYGAAFTPYLSPTGMVQPVALAAPMLQAPNHYAFVQSASEHLQPKDLNYFIGCNYEVTKFGGGRNYEEELVVNDVSLYTKGIIDNSIISKMKEKIRGKYIEYPIIKIKRVKGFPVPVVHWKRFYIWKRTYHTLGDDCLYDYDYVYRYLFKN